MRTMLLWNFLAVILGFVFSTSVMADNRDTDAINAVLLEESFEGNFPPSGWTLFSEGFRMETWQTETSKSHSGTHSALGVTQYAYPCNIWLVTPALNLSSASSAKLFFYEDADSWNTSIGTNYVAVSTTSPSSASAFTNIAVMTPANHPIEGFDGNAQVLNLSAYAGQSTVYVGFHYSCPGAPNYQWYIDDVKVTIPSAHDVMAYSLNMASHYSPNSVVTPQATISNEGLNSETFEVDFGHYDFYGSKIVLDTRTITNLAAQTSQNISFDNHTFGYDEFRFFVETNLAGDMDASNNESSKIINSFPNQKTVVLAEEFTGTWCQYCPGCASALDSLKHTYTDEIAIVAYHNEDDFANSHAVARENYYGISGFPTTIFGGTRWRVGGANAGVDWSGIYADYEQLFFAEQAEFTPYSLELSFTENGQVINATATSTFDAIPLNFNQVIYFALCESHIAYNWQTSMDSLHFVERDLFPSDDGEFVYDGGEPPALGLELLNSVEFSIPSGVVKDHCELIAFIQDPSTKEIMATAMVDLGNDPSAMNDEMKDRIPQNAALFQNYPNPFNPKTIIPYQIGANQQWPVQVDLSIYNLLGQKICTLVAENQKPGTYKVEWDATGFPSGIYLYRLNVTADSKNFEQIQKMILLK